MVRKRKRQPFQEDDVPLKRLRNELGLSQAEFAVALGIDPSTVSRCERGVSELSLTMAQMKRLCKLTGKSIDELPEYLGKSPDDTTNRDQ